jgi:hypothetical protein
MPYTKVPISSLDISNRGLCGRQAVLLFRLRNTNVHERGELCWWPKSLQISFIAAWLMICSSVYISAPPKQCRMPSAYVAQEQKLQSEQMRWAWSFFRDSDAIWCGEEAAEVFGFVASTNLPTDSVIPILPRQNGCRPDELLCLIINVHFESELIHIKFDGCANNKLW